MKKTLLSIFSLFILVIGFQIMLTSSSNGRAFSANSGNTGAPGETTTCRSCHGSGFSTTVSMVIKDTLGVTVSSYIPGAVYDAEFTVNATGASRYGFQMVSLDSSNGSVNGFSMPASNTRLVTLGNGRQYAEHAGKSITSSFSTRWTAPVTGTGTVIFYGGGTAANNNGSTGGDGGNTTTLNLIENTSIGPQCGADFQFVTNGLTVNFQDSSVYSANSVIIHDWNFGDNNIGSGTNPIHTYSVAGTYSACLTIYDSAQTCFDTICKSITVTGGVVPTPCNISYSYSVNPNNTVSFASTITGGTAPFTYSWDFGDGSMISSLQNPSHNYSTTGAYGVTLTVTDSNAATCSYNDTVYVNNCNSFFTSSVGSNGSVAFTNQSSPLNAAQINLSWSFGDGNFSNAVHPTHTYLMSGIYTVSLSYFDSLTNCSSTYSDSVAVQIGTSNSCNASFTKVKDSSVAFGVVLYNTSSNFGSHFYTWDFGDGITGSGRTPIHQYQSFGSYVVCLTITDSLLNCTSMYCDTVGMDSLGNLKTGFGLRVVNPTSVGLTEVNDLNTVNLYPNPATNQIALDLTSVESTLNIRIMDISGRIVMEQLNQNPGKIKNIEINSLESGLYFMVLNNGSSQEIKKFIKH